MIDCRVTPMRAASRSSASTTQAGKSTFMRFWSWLTRRAVDRSSSSATSFRPTSNLRSKSLAFIKLYLCSAGPPDRDKADAPSPVRYNGRPMPVSDPPYKQISLFILCPGPNLQQIRVTPERLGSLEVDPVLVQVGAAFLLVEFKLVHEYKLFPFYSKHLIQWPALGGGWQGMLIAEKAR